MIARTLVSVVSVLLAGSLSSCVPATGPGRAPPNIVVVLADDLGWHELGAYGNRFSETPQLDRLAREGVLFEQAYAAAPVCSPTRAALLTGRHPARLGITDYLRPDDPRHLDPSTPMLAGLLGRTGYTTGLVGKWHLAGDYKNRAGGPERFAWNEVILSERSGIGGGDYFHPYAHLPGVEARASDEYLTDRLSQEAAGFIRRHHGRPFFLLLSHYAPHTKLAGKPSLVARFRGKPGAGEPGKNPELAAMVASIDEGVGLIRSTLEELGLDRRTLFVFTSDNGGEARVAANPPLRAGKSHLYEGGIRVPLIVRWPGVVAPGRTSAESVVTHDLFATFVEVAGVRGRIERDGTSLMPLLTGGHLPPRPLYWHYPLLAPHFLGGRSSGAIRDGTLKLVELFDTGTRELYDLSIDPGEQHDLAAIRPQDADRLADRLRRWRDEVTRPRP